jgi:hypothetical protein
MTCGGHDDLYNLVIDSKLRDVSEYANIILTEAKQH